MKQLLALTFTLLATLAGTATTASAATAAAAEGRHCVLGATPDQLACYSSEEQVIGAQAVVYRVIVVWDDVSYRGNRVDYYATTPCTSPYDDEQNKKAGDLEEMNNDISSWQTIGECSVRFWDGPNFGRPLSALSNVGVDCADMRTCFGSVNWNNRAGSLALT
jgi:hypothetical protein